MSALTKPASQGLLLAAFVIILQLWHSFLCRRLSGFGSLRACGNVDFFAYVTSSGSKSRSLSGNGGFDSEFYMPYTRLGVMQELWMSLTMLSFFFLGCPEDL
eukprot:1159183-Pelagomonas_calceolata.AAC.15